MLTLRTDYYHNHGSIELQTIEIDDAVLITIPHEVSVEVGFIKRRSWTDRVIPVTLTYSMRMY